MRRFSSSLKSPWVGKKPGKKKEGPFHVGGLSRFDLCPCSVGLFRFGLVVALLKGLNLNLDTSLGVYIVERCHQSPDDIRGDVMDEFVDYDFLSVYPDCYFAFHCSSRKNIIASGCEAVKIGWSNAGRSA